MNFEHWVLSIGFYILDFRFWIWGSKIKFDFEPQKPKIQQSKNVFVGANVTIGENLNINSNSTILFGSVVIRNCDSNKT